MPVYFNRNAMEFRDPNGNFQGINMITDQDKSAIVAEVKSTALQEIETELPGIAEDTVKDLVGGDFSLIKSSNIFTGFIENGRINGSTGQDAVSDEYVRSGYVPVDNSKGTLYIIRDTQPYALALYWYDETKAFLTGINTSVFSDNTVNLRQNITIPSNAYYFRTYKPISDSGNLQMSYDNISDFSYDAYHIKSEVIEEKTANWVYENNKSGNIIPLATAKGIGSTRLTKDFSMVNDAPYSYVVESDSGTSQDIIFDLAESINVVGVQAIRLKLFLENVSNISSITFKLFNASDIIFEKVKSVSLLEGWNEIIWPTSQNSYLTSTLWNSFTRFRINISGTGAFTVYVSAIYLDRSDKAKLIFVDDHSYHGFKTLAYPLLKAVGQPVTWALNPGRLGTQVGTQESILTQSDIDELAYDAFSEFSFHNWNPINNPTKAMTPDELRQDFQKCIAYLKKNGICPTHLWRAAYTQNKADNWWVAQDMVEATACHDEGGGFATWPFTDAYNVHRYSIHDRAFDAIDRFFEVLKLTHCTLVLYTHGCVVERTESDSLHCTVAQIEYLADKISTGVSEGWLEPTTYNRLATMKEHGMYTLNTT